MPEFTDKVEVMVREASDDGENVRKLALVEGYDEEEDRTFEYVAFKRGYIESVTTLAGDEALAERITDSASLGSPDDIRELIDGLEDLDAELNGS